MGKRRRVKPVGRWRTRQRERLRRMLERDRHPRLALAVIALLTGLAGFAVSAVLLWWGLTLMWVRYALAVLAAYGVFLFFVWAWLRREHPDGDMPNASCDSPGNNDWQGGGGNFGGGGASADYSDDLAAPDPVAAETGSVVSEVISGTGETAGAAAGEGCLPAVLVVFLVACLGMLGWWVLSFAPILVAELLVDVLLIAMLYRRMRRTDGHSLFQALIRRTRVAFLVLLATMSLAGGWVQWRVPNAVTLGQAWKAMHPAQ